MRISQWAATGVLGLALVSASAQDMGPKDTYTAADAGKLTPPAKALDTMLSLFESEVVAAAKAMPADKFSFAPSSAIFAPGSPATFATVRTFADQLTHIASANYYFYSKVSSSPMPDDVKALKSLKSKDEVVAALQKSFAYAHTQVATITPANAFMGVEGADGQHTPATVAAFAVAHGYDHYGQMVEYLRMNGVLPPGSK